MTNVLDYLFFFTVNVTVLVFPRSRIGNRRGSTY